MRVSDTSKTNEKAAGINVRTGLAVASLGFSVLTTVFGMFHVDMFLKVFELSPNVFSGGSVLFAIINALNDVGGAWMVDKLALTHRRSDLVGLTGCVFALCAITPFFRPLWIGSGWLASGSHFVITVSLYDTLYSFAMILTGSIISDDSEMTNQSRIHFSMICKIVNMVASTLVARTGLYLFDITSMVPFQWFVVAIAGISCLLTLTAQGLIHRHWNLARLLLPQKVASSSSTGNLILLQVVKDLKGHSNFWSWICMEMLLESQNTMNVNFRKTFMDELVVRNGFDKNFCDWILSMMRPMTTICSLLIFIPIQRFGYPRVYTCIFVFNAMLSFAMLSFANSNSGSLIFAFLIVYPIAVSSAFAGFSLAMADMVLEMKHSNAKQNRLGEPSLAGLFMGANALFCKPCESVLPILGAQALSGTGRQRDLFRVLVLPPLVFSILQLLSWRSYNLDTQRVDKLRSELRNMLASSSSEDTESGHLL